MLCVGGLLKSVKLVVDIMADCPVHIPPLALCSFAPLIKVLHNQKVENLYTTKFEPFQIVLVINQLGPEYYGQRRDDSIRDI